MWAATDRAFWLRLAIAANVGAVAMALVAAVPGFLDWALGIPSGTRAKAVGLRHMALNLGALALFAVTLGIYATKWSHPGRAGATLGVVLSALGVLLNVAAGWLGWSLVQDHHVGVNEFDDRGQPLEARRRRIA